MQKQFHCTRNSPFTFTWAGTVSTSVILVCSLFIVFSAATNSSLAVRSPSQFSSAVLNFIKALCIGLASGSCCSLCSFHVIAIAKCAANSSPRVRITRNIFMDILHLIGDRLAIHIAKVLLLGNTTLGG